MTTNRTKASGRVIVIGGGIAGLAAAFRLKQAGVDVTVLEQADRVGGRMTTVEHDGYRIDAAASVLPTTYRRTLRLIGDAGLTGDILPTCDVLGIAGQDGVHHLRASRRSDLVTTGLFGARTKAAFSRVLVDLYRHRRAFADLSSAAIDGIDVETVEQYARRTVPQDAFDLFIQPLTSDFYLTPPDELSVVNLFLLLRTMLGTKFVNSARGVRFLPEGLSRQLRVELSATVTSVEHTSRGAVVAWDRPGELERVDTVDGAIVAVPAVHVPALMPSLAGEHRDFLKSVSYARSMVVSLRLSRPPAESAMWLTVPDTTHPDVNVMILDHNKAPGRVPPGRAMATVYWHRDWALRHWELSDEKVLPQAIAAVAQVVPDVEGQVEGGHVWRWDPCAVARPVGQFRALAAFRRQWDPTSRVQLAGDYLSISTVDNSLASGEDAAARLIRCLRADPTR